MKLGLVIILAILTLAQLAFAQQHKITPSFQTGKLQLSASFTEGEKHLKTYSVFKDHQERDRLTINILDLKANNDLYQLQIPVIGWEVRISEDSLNTIILEVNQQIKKIYKSNWFMKISYLIFRNLQSSYFYVQDLRLSRQNYDYPLNNGMTLFISDTENGQQQKANNYKILIMNRGIQFKNTLLLQQFFNKQIKIQGYFIAQLKIKLKIQPTLIKYFFITLIVIKQQYLTKVSHNFHSSTLKLHNKQKWLIQKCKQDLVRQEDCWEMKSQANSFNFISNQQQNYNNPNHIVQGTNIQNLLTKSRILNTCSQIPCSCSSIAYALQCFIDTSCQCRVKVCSDGYYGKDQLSVSCNRCPTGLTHCLTCNVQGGSSNPVCTSCQPGYALINSGCSVCPSNCLNCTTVVVSGIAKISCTVCLATFTLQTVNSIAQCQCLSDQFKDTLVSPSVCVDCPTTCSACTSSTSCTTCLTGYYLSGLSCLACMPVCKSCLSGSTCSTCFSTTFVIISGICTCPSPLFFDIVTKSCLSCSSLQINCAFCNYSSTYDPANPTSVVCVTANSGYYIVNGSAVACISYCSDCNLTPSPLCSVPMTNFFFDGTSCICASGLYFSPAADTCLACSQAILGCANCENTTIPSVPSCSLCSSGYFTPSASYPTTSCSACPSLCLSCTALNACTSCVNNLTILGDGSCGCDSTSSLYLNPSNLYCTTCDAIIFDCKTCSTTATSLICVECIIGNYPSSSGLTCYPCPLTCSNCTNSTYCTSCEVGYDLVSDQCVCGTSCTDCISNSTDGACASCTYSSFTCLSCIVGFYNISGQCYACNSTWGSYCIECTQLNCLSCSSPFILDSAGCICNNTDGLYLSTNGSTCLSCSSAISQCVTCSGPNPTACLVCSVSYYVSSSQVCSPCTGNCLTCSISSSNCDSCLLTYSMVSSNTCACNNTGGYFYDSSTGGCSACSVLISNCATCSLNASNETYCSTCASTYYWNISTLTCQSCSSNCFNCSAYSVCTSCSSGLIVVSGECVCDNTTIPTVYLDLSSGTCQQCSFIITGCTSCSMNNLLVVCVSCVSSTYLINNTCLNCPTDCATCDANGCVTCPNNMTLLQGSCICSTQCSQCNALSVGCTSCSITSNAITNCYSCLPGTFLASPNCDPCPSSCATCTSGSNCVTCQNTFVLIGAMCSCATSIGIFPNTAGSCSSCGQIYYSCSQCDIVGGSTVCITCSAGYYLSGNSCLPCDTGCLTCSGLATTCTSCPVGQTLNVNVCACSTASCLACSAVSLNCTQCLYTIYGNFSKCQICQSGFYLNGVNCSPCPTVCKLCGANGACLSCDATFEVINQTCLCDNAQNMWKSGNTCISCGVLYANCQTCLQNVSAPLNVSCTVCNYGSYLNNDVCVLSVCGDGVITSGEVCDDNNTNNKDGCSSLCQVQTNYVCIGSPSNCSYSNSFAITPTNIDVSKTICNQVAISFQLSPAYDSLNSANFKNMFGFTNQSRISYKSYSYSKGTVKYYFDFSETLNDAQVIFYFSPSSLLISETITVPITIVKVKLTPTNNILMVHYNESICNSKAAVSKLTKAIEYMSYFTLVASALPCKIVGLQLFGVLQLAHINIGNMDNVNTMMTPLMGMKGVHGLTLDFGKQSSSSSRLLQLGYTPSRVQSIGYQSNFLRNCNFMLFIVILVILISAMLYALTYCCKQYAPSLYSVSKRIIKEVLLTLILFNCYNFAYSAGLHFKYAPKSDSLYPSGTIAAVLSLILPILMVLTLMCTDDDGFGEYKQKFKPGLVEKMYFVVTILYRTGIGLYISIMNEEEMSTLIVLSLSIAFLLYNLINLPYIKAYHNYRANICHFTQFICLFIALYYRSMMSTTSKTSVSTIFSPVYLQLSCIFISLTVSLVVLSYEIYLFVIDCIKTKRKRERLNSDFSIADKSINHGSTLENIGQDRKEFQTEEIT